MISIFFFAKLENLYAIHKEEQVNPIGIWIRVFSRMSDYWTNLVAYYPLMAVFAWEKDDKPWDLGGYPIVTYSQTRPIGELSTT